MTVLEGLGIRERSMTQTSEQSDILERIRKLLMLTTSNHQGEVENATLKAQELMLKYNISLIQLEEDSPQIPSLGEVSHEEIIQELSHRKHAWKGILVGVLTGAFLCSGLQSQNGFVIVGTEPNRAIVITLYEWLVDLLPKIVRQEYRRYQEEGGMYSRRLWSNSFYLGCIYSIRDKLKAQSEEMDQGTGLVLYSQKELSSYVEDNFRIGKGKKGLANFAQRGYEKGYETGKGLDLNTRRQLRG